MLSYAEKLFYDVLCSEQLIHFLTILSLFLLFFSDFCELSFFDTRVSEVKNLFLFRLKLFFSDDSLLFQIGQFLQFVQFTNFMRLARF